MKSRQNNAESHVSARQIRWHFVWRSGAEWNVTLENGELLKTMFRGEHEREADVFNLWVQSAKRHLLCGLFQTQWPS